jgi:hypothetical protein
MNQRSFILGTLLIVIAFIFAVGAMAIYTSGEEKTSSSSYAKGSTDSSYSQSNAQDYTPTQYGNQVVINKYSSQSTPLQSSTSYCHQQVTSYYNNQPVVQCIPDGTPTMLVDKSPSQVTKINIYNSGNSGYYPYPKYNYYYHKYPHYSYNYNHYKPHPPYFQYW